jgi:hypothetical protein
MMVISIFKLRVKYVMFQKYYRSRSDQCLEKRITQRQAELIVPALPSMLRVSIQGDAIGHIKAKSARIR